MKFTPFHFIYYPPNRWVFCVLVFCDYIRTMQRFLLAFLLLLCCTLVKAQESPFVFSHLTEDNGLVDNVVNSFLKDSRGILWIGTYNGFSRFDGSNFYNYKKRKGTNSMLNEVVHKLCEDKKGNIWGATNNGVFRYQPQRDSFTNYALQVLGRTMNCFNILCDRSGNIWASSGSSLFRYNPTAEKFDEKLQLAASPDSVRNYLIAKNGLREDPAANGLWIATHAGLQFYDISKQTAQGYSNTATVNLFKRRDVVALAPGSNGNFWFFDNEQKEIVLFNTGSRRELKKINVKAAMPEADGGTLFEDNNQRLWFSSWSYELLIIDLKDNNKVYKLLHHDDNKRSVAGLFFWDVYEDNDNNIWLGTISGISKCNPEKANYKLYQLPAFIPELKNTAIQLAEQNPADGSIWMITKSSLLIRYNPADQQYSVHSFKDAQPAPGGAVPGLCNGIKFFNDITIIPTRSGIWQLKKGSNRIVPFQYLPKGFDNFACTDMEMDGDSVLYFTNGKAILYWNHVAGIAQLIPVPQTDTTGGRIKIIKLVFTPARKLWALAHKNYSAVLNEKKELVRINIIDDKTMETGVFIGLDQAKNGDVWALVRGVGIYHYNPANGSVQIKDETDGLAGNRIQRMLIDKSGHVWNIIYNKVSVYIPGSNKFYNFKIPYSESDLDYISYLTRLANGNVMGTINNDIVEFYPERLLGTPAKTKPQISQLIVSGKNVSLFNKMDIVLQPDENTIRFRFGSLINKEIFPYDIEYKLEAAEKGWTTDRENHEALYNNLNPGKYTFRVRVRGKNSDWQTEEAVIVFTIKTPFYKTTGFIAAMLLLVTTMLFFTYRYRVSQKEKLLNLENKAQSLEKEKAMVMYENLKQQLNPHFLFNSLTSLNSLIEAEPKMASEFLDSLSKTYRYILKSRDNEVVPLADEMRFAANYVKLQKTRFEKGFNVKMNIPEEYYYRKIVPVTLQNLIENAIKHNIIDEESPLLINIYVENELLVVENNLQRKNFVETSNRQGLANMQSLYQYLSNQPVEVIETTDFFKIKLPLL